MPASISDIAGSIQANKTTGDLLMTGSRIGNGLQGQHNSPAPIGGADITEWMQGRCQGFDAVA